MRFAWLRESSSEAISITPSYTKQLILVAYNLIWWVPILLPFTRLMTYRTGFILFLMVTLVRAVANAIRINLLPLEQAVNFPLRAP
jgi:hypothetical protein